MSELALLLGYGVGLFVLAVFAGFGLVLGGIVAIKLYEWAWRAWLWVP